MLSDAEITFDDPEFPNEDDPVFEGEVFAACRYMGWTPAMFPDPEHGAKYDGWLKNNPPESE
jgi:hypothetical protein